MNQEKCGKKMSQLIAKCWADEGFKQKLLADPAATLKADGVELPAGLSVKALENTDKLFHLVIPAKPSGAMSDDELADVAGGGWRGGVWVPQSTTKVPPLATATSAQTAGSRG